MKKIIALALTCIMALSFTACNYQFIDLKYDFDYAIVKFPDDTIRELEIASWSDYDGEQIQIKTTDGTIYVVSSFNCVLVKE